MKPTETSTSSSSPLASNIKAERATSPTGGAATTGKEHDTSRPDRVTQMLDALHLLEPLALAVDVTMDKCPVHVFGRQVEEDFRESLRLVRNCLRTMMHEKDALDAGQMISEGEDGWTKEGDAR